MDMSKKRNYGRAYCTQRHAIAMTAETRIRSNSEQKRALREHHAAHPDMTRQELSKWAASAFKLPRPLTQTSLTDLLKRQEDDTERNPLRKASHCAHSHELEAQLVLWINRCNEIKLPIPTPTTVAVLSKLMFSKGWLYRFQQRQGLKSRRTYGEADLVKNIAIENGRRVLQAVTSLYDKKDIFNMDEIAYFYCSIPVTSNADGSTKILLLFVGTARQPRCFEGKSAEELGIQYANAAKGWMNTELLTNWIERFSERMKSEGRHVLLLLDNVSSHRVIVPLSNVTFKSKLEQLKTRYIVGKFDELLDKAAEIGNENVETQIESLYTVDVLQAMQWAQETWETVTSTTDANCWHHTKIIDDELYEIVESIKQVALGQ
uniref:Jerky putative n=1 Tax=Albugo laibachii Nc14 TaxID=890382 RepID=F0WW74_9STRA|nr:jerky putative [Albugo laibachii Nc14]|eukprot:CCA25693.1 jerky putative [Albugo laibachii Nc14]